MKTKAWVVASAVILLFGNMAQAETQCDFKGDFGEQQHTLRCKAQLTGTCNPVAEHLQGKGTFQEKSTCSGFEVWCNGRKLTQGTGQCTGVNVQQDGNYGIAQFQYTDGDGSECVFPAVKFDFPLPPQKTRTGARLYLSKHKVLFGSCDLEGIVSTP